MLRLILRRGDGVYSTLLVRVPDIVPEGCELVGVELEHGVTRPPVADSSAKIVPDVSEPEAGIRAAAPASESHELPYRHVASEVWILIDEQGVPVPSTIGENGQATIIACSEFEAAQRLRDYQKNFDIQCSALRIR